MNPFKPKAKPATQPEPAAETRKICLGCGGNVVNGDCPGNCAKRGKKAGAVEIDLWKQMVEQ